jgi:hypothetical protein
MRTNNTFVPENTLIFKLQNSAIREQNLHEEPDKTAPTPENPAFPDFLEMKSYFVLACSQTLPAVSAEAGVYRKGLIYPAFRDLRDIRGAPPALWRSTFGGVIIRPEGEGAGIPHPRHAQLHSSS